MVSCEYMFDALEEHRDVERGLGDRVPVVVGDATVYG